jgi:multidrug efflux pump subunit AcrA (membrane-fusion protein)
VGIARKWVFPIIWMVVFAIIAGALVKIAFFPDAAEAEGTEFPTGQIVEPQVPAMLGTIRNDVVLDGTVNADAAVPAKATLAGEVVRVYATAGQWVDPATKLLQIKALVPNADGSTSTKWANVTAGAAGTLSALPVLVGQMVSVGEDVAQVAPPTFNVTATLSPELQYRLLNKPTEAEVQVTGGPAPFVCTGLTITTPLAGAGSGGGGNGETGGTGGSTTTVHCAVPAEVTVFAGLTAKVTIAGGIAENVLTVPLTAVEGAAQSGVVYFVLPDGSTEQRPVTLGINDGVSVEITEGLAEGELVLQFVPGAPAVDPNMPGGGKPIDGVVVMEGAAR